MGWRKTDAEKKAEGTYRSDRAAPVLPLAEAEAQLSDILTKLTAAEAKLTTLGSKKKATARRNLEKRIRILQGHRARALEALTAAAAAEQARANAPSIRPGLELMSSADCAAAQPPLNEAEQLEWLVVGPHDSMDLIRRKVKAALPLSAAEVKVLHLDLDHLNYLLAQGKELSTAAAAHLAEVKDALAYAEAQPGGLPAEDATAPSLYQVFIDRLRENAAKGFSTKRSRQILKDHEARQKRG
ncbi:MAG: hypothetical protein WCC22_07530 [Terriglobales bacterium]